jgi:hypothetical protein
MIKDGQVASADDVLNNLGGQQFKNYANLLWNASLIGLDSSLVSSFSNLLYSTTPVAGVGSTSTRNPLIPYTAIDELNNSSLDGAIWTSYTDGSGTKTITEGTDGVSIEASGNNVNTTTAYILSKATAHNFYANESIIIPVSAYTYSDIGTNAVQLFDGTNAVTILNFPADYNTAVTFAKTNYRLNIDKDGKTCNMTTDLQSVTKTGIDISSLSASNDWCLRFYCQKGSSSGSGTSSMIVYCVRIITTSGTADYIFDLGTTATMTDVIPAISITSGAGTTATHYIASNGTNYETITDKTIHRFSDTGTTPKYKISVANSSGSYPYINFLNHYAFWYNLGAS